MYAMDYLNIIFIFHINSRYINYAYTHYNIHLNIKNNHFALNNILLQINFKYTDNFNCSVSHHLLFEK